MNTAMQTAQYRLTRRQLNYQRFKRAADFCIALVVLILLAIPFAIIAVIQKLLEPGEPVFFRQERYGQGGAIIRITKFRSMKSAVDSYLPTYEAPVDDCMTRFGRFLRDTSIDELPQLAQVLTGKMSIIGPRPLIPQEEDIHRLREINCIYLLRPGLTGWAQVNGRDYVTDTEKVAFDREYLENMSYALDRKIFWRTVKAVIRRENIM